MKLKKKSFIEAYIKTFGNITAACKSIKIDRGTYYNWMEKDEEFKNTINTCEPRESYKDFIESKLCKLINNDTPSAIIFAAKTICKDRGYVERTEHDHTTKGESLHKKLNELPEDELRKLADGLDT